MQTDAGGRAHVKHRGGRQDTPLALFSAPRTRPCAPRSNGGSAAATRGAQGVIEACKAFACDACVEPFKQQPPAPPVPLESAPAK
eukprot:6627598-Pyramimonas_sp.AAC.2